MPTKPLLIVCALLLIHCAETPCMKSYKYHLKANFAVTGAEKAYYENEAKIYDNQCADFNDREYKNRQDEESRRHQ